MKRYALVIFVLFTAVTLLSTGAEVKQENKIKERIITQGEFAVLYCNAVSLEKPTEGWNPANASSTLSGKLDVAPEEGWRLDADLTEGVMVSLVQAVGINLVTAYPDRKVTVRKANAVFAKFETMFNKLHPEHKTVTDENATYVEPLGNPSKSSY